MSPGNKENLRHNLALDKLGEEQAEEVSTFFMTSKEAQELQANKDESLRKRSEEKMAAMDLSQASTENIIIALTNQILEESRRKHTNEIYIDANGLEHVGGYKALFNQVLDDVEVDVEGTDKDQSNPVRKKAEAIVLGVLRAVPLNLRPKYCHQFAEDMIRDYVKKMDDKAETVYWGTLKEDELNSIKPLSFQEWIAAPERAGLPDLYIELNDAQARKFTTEVAKVKAVLKNIKTITGLNNDMMEYLAAAAKSIEVNVTGNTALALKNAEELENQAKAAVALASVHEAVTASIGEVATVKTQVPNFDATIETGYVKLKSDIEKRFTDFIAAKDAKILDKTSFEATKTQLDTKLATEKAKIQATVVPPTPGKPNENDPTNPNNPPAEEKKKWSYTEIINDPGGWIMEKLPWLAVVFAFVPKLQAQFSALIAKAKGKTTPASEKKDSDKPSPAEGAEGAGAAPPAVAVAPGVTGADTTETAETPSQKAAREALEKQKEAIEKSTKYIKEKFIFTEDEMKIITPMKVTDLLKLQESPIGIEKTKFAALKQSVTFNGGTSETPDTIIEFVSSKGENWQEPLVAAATANPPVTPTTNAPGSPNPKNPPAGQAG